MLTELLPWRYIAGFFTVGAALGLLWIAIENNDAAQQQIGYDRAVSEYAAEKAIADQAALAKERAMQKTMKDAENVAIERDKKLRIDYAASRAAALGLRSTITDLRSQLATAPADTFRPTAAAALDVFADCADRYRAVAEAADGHAADVQTLTDAWPK